MTHILDADPLIAAVNRDDRYHHWARRTPRRAARRALLRHLRQHGCVLKREGASHSLWMNPANGAVEAVPGHYALLDLR
jgi:hypothetical protein